VTNKTDLGRVEPTCLHMVQDLCYQLVCHGIEV
jgi:hypothetical protein